MKSLEIRDKTIFISMFVAYSVLYLQIIFTVYIFLVIRKLIEMKEMLASFTENNELSDKDGLKKRKMFKKY